MEEPVTKEDSPASASHTSSSSTSGGEQGWVESDRKMTCQFAFSHTYRPCSSSPLPPPRPSPFLHRPPPQCSAPLSSRSPWRCEGQRSLFAVVARGWRRLEGRCWVEMTTSCRDRKGTSCQPACTHVWSDITLLSYRKHGREKIFILRSKCLKMLRVNRLTVCDAAAFHLCQKQHLHLHLHPHPFVSSQLSIILLRFTLLKLTS